MYQKDGIMPYGSCLVSLPHQSQFNNILFRQRPSCHRAEQQGVSAPLPWRGWKVSPVWSSPESETATLIGKIRRRVIPVVETSPGAAVCPVVTIQRRSMRMRRPQKRRSWFSLLWKRYRAVTRLVLCAAAWPRAEIATLKPVLFFISRGVWLSLPSQEERVGQEEEGGV